MRILIGVTVSRKMLSGGEDTVLLQPVNERLAHVGNEARILTEGSHANDWIRRIVVDVEHGSERDVNAKRPRFECRDAPFLVGERRVTSGADTHLIREHRPATEIDVV